MPCRGPCAIRGFPGCPCRPAACSPTHPDPLRPADGLGPRAAEPGGVSGGPGAGVGGNVNLMQPEASFFLPGGGRTAGPGWTQTFAAHLRMGRPGVPDWGFTFVLISQIKGFLTSHGHPGGGGYPAMPHSLLDTPKCPLCWLACKWLHFPFCVCVSRSFPLLSSLNHLIEVGTDTHTPPHTPSYKVESVGQGAGRLGVLACLQRQWVMAPWENTHPLESPGALRR